MPPPGTYCSASRPAEPGWASNFHDGKDWDDLSIAIEVYNDAVAGAGIQAPANEFIWRPLRSQVEFDFLWASYTENMSAWGRNMTARVKSQGGSLADAVFESVIDCDSTMNFVELIYDSDELAQSSRDRSNPNVLESYVCSLNEGKTWDDLMVATGLWHGYVTRLASPMDVYRRTPLIGHSPDTDVAYFAVHQDLAQPGRSSSSASRVLGWSCSSSMYRVTMARASSLDVTLRKRSR